MSDDATYFKIEDELRREYYSLAQTIIQQLRDGTEATQEQRKQLENLGDEGVAQGPPMPKEGEIYGYQILEEVEKTIGIDWYEKLTETEYPPPTPPNTRMAYWSTRTGKHLSFGHPNDVVVQLFNKRVVYLQEIKGLSKENSIAQANHEFNNLTLGQKERSCESCGGVFNPAHDVSKFSEKRDRDNFYGYLQRKTCSTKCSLTLKWQNLVKNGMLPDAEFDRTISWESVWERFGPYCYICGIETIHNQEDLGLRMGTKVWKARWGNYRRGDIDRIAVVEHVYPRSKGGTHTWDNVRIACSKCNLRKGDSIPNNYGLGSRPQP